MHRGCHDLITIITTIYNDHRCCTTSSTRRSSINNLRAIFCSLASVGRACRKQWLRQSAYVGDRSRPQHDSLTTHIRVIAQLVNRPIRMPHPF